MSARPGSVIPIEDVDGRAFDILLKLVCNTVFAARQHHIPHVRPMAQKKREETKFINLVIKTKLLRLYQG